MEVGRKTLQGEGGLTFLVISTSTEVKITAVCSGMVAFSC